MINLISLFIKRPKITLLNAQNRAAKTGVHLVTQKLRSTSSYPALPKKE